MRARRAAVVLIIATICAVATPTSESNANANCYYNLAWTTQYWYPNSCGPGPHPPGTICNDVLTLAGESGVDCAGNAWSSGDTNPALYQTHSYEVCEPICD